MKSVIRWKYFICVAMIVLNFGVYGHHQALCAVVLSGNYAYQNTELQNTKYGMIEGKKADGTNSLAWLGIPYAQPPIGELRWHAPKDPVKWDGVLETKQFQNISAQLAGENVVGSEDCLYLNIWRPNTKQEKLPVFVFLHGGGNITGSGEWFQGDRMAEETNSIIISVNYRLGAMGYFYNDAIKTGNKLDDSGNYGLLDAFKALEWVQKNIDSFGGDANNVTLGGQSAGARDVLAALISPLSKGLFHKAVIMSGGMTLTEPEQGQEFSTQKIMQLLEKDGLAPSDEMAQKSSEEVAKYLRSKDVKEFVNAYGAVAIKMAPFPHLYKDGYVIPCEGFDVIKKGKYNKVPVILGSTANEFALFAATDPYFGKSVFDLGILKQEQQRKVYEDAVYFGSKIYAGFNAEKVADLLVKDGRQTQVFAYRFAWGTQPGIFDQKYTSLLNAWHGSDIDFLTGRDDFWLDKAYPKAYYTEQNRQGRTELRNDMMAYVANFLYTGNPNHIGLPKWETWQLEKGKDRILRLDADSDKALIRMSSEYMDKQEIIQDMETKVPVDERKIIIEKLFDGRFFWYKDIIASDGAKVDVD